jgi:WhiB family redox-sensing transcriptional regulator
MTWHSRAACLEADPDLFFPIGESGPALLQIAEAKRVCGRCPVRQQCLEWAITTGQHAGVWGGLSESERHALTRRRARQSRRAPAAAPA